MGLRVNTNVPSIHSQEVLRRNRLNLEQDSRAGSSGKRINEAADDAAGLSISEYSRGKNVSLGQAIRNANDGVSVVQVAEGGMQEIGNILIRLKELSIQAASATIGNTERGFIGMEVKQLKEQINNIAASTEFDNRKLLGMGMGDWDVQIGIDNTSNNRFSWSDLEATTKDLGVDWIDLSNIHSAQNSISALDNALDKIVEQRTKVGGMQNRLQSVIRGGLITDENQKATISRIKDADIAKVSADLAKESVLNQSAISILAQANTSNEKAIKLLQL